MPVNLSAVGVFYNRTVAISGDPTVKQVMDAANQNRLADDPYFLYGYVTVGSKIIANNIAAYHYKPFTGRNPTPTYGAGWYSLSQGPDFSQNPYTIWQYYLFDQNNQRVPLPANTSFTVQKVQQNWKIVWRLVSILNKPTGLNPRLQGAVPKELAAHMLTS